MYKEYQAQRPKADEELVSQFQKVKDVVGAFKISMYEKKGFEADDVIGTIAKRLTNKKTKKNIDEVVVVTGDKDQFQLVDEKIKVYLPIRGLSNAKLMGVRDVYGKLGVYPEQVVDYKALVGDPSDNYPGVYGIGPKTAEKLLIDYQNLNGVYDNLNKLKESVRKRLEKGKKDGLTSYELARIVTDVPVKIDLNKMGKWSLYNDDVERLFTLWGFRSLKQRVKKLEDVQVKPKNNENTSSQGSLF
jgi:DNA polymerase-1